jgi:hypothetical protein
MMSSRVKTRENHVISRVDSTTFSSFSLKTGKRSELIKLTEQLLDSLAAGQVQTHLVSDSLSPSLSQGL